MGRRPWSDSTNLLSQLRDKGPRGLSLLEVIVAGSIISVILAAIFGTFKVGLTASFKGMGQNEVLSQLQLGVGTLHREVGQTNIHSSSIGPDQGSLAFLTHYDPLGKPSIGADGQPAWRAFRVFYLDSLDSTLKARRVELTASSPLAQFPAAIEAFNPGSGTRPLADYLDSGQPQARLIESFRVLPDPLYGEYLDFEFVGLKPKEGVRSKSRAKLNARVYPRN